MESSVFINRFAISLVRTMQFGQAFELVHVTSAEGIMARSAIAIEIAHVFNDSDGWNVQLLEHLHTLDNVHVTKTVGSGHDHGCTDS
jgi:hypothetical protein